MKTWKAIYAHCTKATLGKPDREPWYTYEKREIDLTAEQVQADEQFEAEMKVSTMDGRFWATETTQHDATQVVLYKLMAASRKAAENKVV